MHPNIAEHINIIAIPDPFPVPTMPPRRSCILGEFLRWFILRWCKKITSKRIKNLQFYPI